METEAGLKRRLAREKEQKLQKKSAIKASKAKSATKHTTDAEDCIATSLTYVIGAITTLSEVLVNECDGYNKLSAETAGTLSGALSQLIIVKQNISHADEPAAGSIGFHQDKE